MRTKIVECTNGPNNWGKFLVGAFDSFELVHRSPIDGRPTIIARGWRASHVLVLDLQTGEGAMFRLGGLARYDLQQHKIWVCPLFEPFLEWLYQQPDPLAIPDHVDLPDAEFDLRGHRRCGSTGAELVDRVRLLEAEVELLQKERKR